MFAIKTPNGFINADRFDTRAEAQAVCDDLNSDDFFGAHNGVFTVVEVPSDPPLNERNLGLVNYFNPLATGDGVRIDGVLWAVIVDGTLELRQDARNWRTVHPTLQGFTGQVEFIRACQEAAQVFA